MPCCHCWLQVRSLYKGGLRLLLVLLHDFPEFLCQHHGPLCDAIPPSAVQLRNLVLSAFPRHMRLPDPFTPGLKVIAATARGWGVCVGTHQDPQAVRMAWPGALSNVCDGVAAAAAAAAQNHTTSDM